MAVQRDKVIASAEKLVAKGKIEPAIKEYERLLDDNPNDVNTLNRIGDLWVRINRNEEAVKVFSKIADHYSRDGFFLKAIAIFKKINKLDPSKLDIYAKLADLYAKQGLAMEAKSQYQVLADYYLKHGDPGNALGIYRKISELDPNSINVHVKLADLYSQNNQTAEALKEYDRVGRMLLKRGMLDEAVQVFRKALKIDAGNSELVESLVTALLEAKDYENASQIVQTSLEGSPSNARILAIAGRIALAKGDAPGARQALERGLAANPDELSIRETLAEMYLKTGNTDKALEMLAPLSEKALARADRGTAVELLNRVLRVDSGHTPTLERLVALYSRLNEETNILASMNSLAEAHMARGQYEQASAVLDKLIMREPQNAQHRNKLQFVRSQMGGVDTIPAHARSSAPPPPPPPVSLEIDEPVPSFEDDGISLDLDASEPIDLDLSMDEPVVAAPPPPPPPPPVAAAPPPRLPSAVEMAASDLADEAGDDLDFITEHLTEAEVFAKYGLAEKAAEHLRAVIERAPKHLAAHERLFRILLDEGDIDAARAAATQYINVLGEKGDQATIDMVRQEFVARGHSLAPAAPAPRPAPARTPTIETPAPTIELTEVEELSFDLDSGPSDFDLGATIAEPEPEPEPAFASAAPVTIEEEPTFDLSLDEPLPELEPEPEPVEIMEPEPEPILEISEPEPTFDLLEEPEPELEPEFATTEEPFFGTEASHESLIDQPAIEEIGEIDFYIEQELFDEARNKVDTLLARFPDNDELASRKDRLAAATAAAAAAAPAAIPPPPRARSRCRATRSRASCSPRSRTMTTTSACPRLRPRRRQRRRSRRPPSTSARYRRTTSSPTKTTSSTSPRNSSRSSKTTKRKSRSPKRNSRSRRSSRSPRRASNSNSTARTTTPTTTSASPTRRWVSSTRRSESSSWRRRIRSAPSNARRCSASVSSKRGCRSSPSSGTARASRCRSSPRRSTSVCCTTSEARTWRSATPTTRRRRSWKCME